RGVSVAAPHRREGAKKQRGARGAHACIRAPLRVLQVPRQEESVADTKWMQKIEHALGETAVKSHRRPGVALAMAVVLTVAGGYFEERSLYYRSLEDLQEVQRRIKDREKYERRQANPMFVKLDDEEVPSLDMSDIEAKYGKRSDQRLASGGDYYLDEKERMI